MVKPKTKHELELMKQSGKIAVSALSKALKAAKVGVTAMSLEEIAKREIYKLGGDLSYKTVPGYKFATCITFNEEVVHGLPSERKIEAGDVISIDLAVMYKGMHTDTAKSILVGQGSRVKGQDASVIASVAKQSQSEKEKFLKVGEEALMLGIAEAIEGHTIGDISNAIQQKVERAGFHVVRSFVGHGVGNKLHEDPEIPGYGRKGTGLVLEEGMTLAIEVIFAKGTPDVKMASDGWTYSSADGSLSGLFEMTVVVGKNKAEILTDWRKE